MKNKYIKIVSLVLAILLGIFIFIFGGYDDSPGAQLLGFIILTFGVVGLIRMRRKK